MYKEDELDIKNMDKILDICLSHYHDYVKDANIEDIKIDYFEDNEDNATFEVWFNEDYSKPIPKEWIKIKVEE